MKKHASLFSGLIGLIVGALLTAGVMHLLTPASEEVHVPQKVAPPPPPAAVAPTPQQQEPLREPFKPLYALRLTTASTQELALHFSVLDEVALTLGENLFISPAVDNLSISYSWWREAMILEGNFKPETTYTVTLKEGIRAKKGEKLLRDSTLSITTPALRPEIDFFHTKGQMPLTPTTALAYTSSGCEKITAKAYRAFSNNLAIYGQSRYSDEKLELCGEITFEVKNNTLEKQPALLPLYELVKGKPGAYRFTLESSDGCFDECYVILSNLGASYVYDHRNCPIVALQDLLTGAPVVGAEVALYDEKHQCIARGLSGVDGIAVTEPTPLALSRKTAVDPKRIILTCGEDQTIVECDSSTEHTAYQRTAADPARFETMLWPDRDGLHPGETVHIYGLLRDRTLTAAPSLPLTIKLTAPQGQTITSEKVITNAEGLFTVDFTLPQGAESGTYTLWAMLDDECLATTQLYVADFTANHIKLSAAFEEEATRLTIHTETYFGTPVQKGVGHYTLTVEEAPLPETLSDWCIGTGQSQRQLVSEAFDKDSKTATETLQGIDPSELKDFSTPVRVKANVSFSEPNNRAVSTLTWTDLTLAPAYLALQYNETSQALLLQQYIPQGKTYQPRRVHAFTLTKIEHRYALVERNNQWRYAWSQETSDVSLSGVTDHERTLEKGIESLSLQALPPGYYSLTATMDVDGQALQTEVTFYHATSDLGKRLSNPSSLVFTTHKPSYQPGEEAMLSFEAPVDGQLFITMGDSELQASTTDEVKAGMVQVLVPIPETCTHGQWTVGVTLVAHDPTKEARYFGVAEIPVDQSKKRLNVTLEAPKVVTPQETVTVKLKVSDDSGAPVSGTVALFAVDEAVLDVTGFQTPDPFTTLFEKKGSTFTFGDLYSALLPQLHLGPDGHIGGDKALFNLASRRDAVNVTKATTVITLPLQTLDATGVLEVPVTLPHFTGSLRFMAVVAHTTKVGSAETTMVVRTPVTLTLSGARYGCAGDMAEVTARIINHDLPQGDYTLTFGDQCLTGHIAMGETVYHTIRVPLGETQAQFTMGDVTVSATHTSQLQGEVPTHTMVRTGILAKGEPLPEHAVALPSLAQAQQIALDWLAAYPYKCTEQLAARMLPYTQSQKPEEQAFVKSIFSSLKPRFSPLGFFTLWDEGSHMHCMATLAASHVMIEGSNQGLFGVEDLPKILQVLNVIANNHNPEVRGEAAYAAYLLGEAGAKTEAIHAARHLLVTHEDDTAAFVAAATLVLHGAADEGTAKAQAFLENHPRPLPLIEPYMDGATTQAMVFALAMRAGLLPPEAAEERLATLLSTPWTTTQANAWAARALATCDTQPQGTLYRMTTETTALQASSPLKISKRLINREGEPITTLKHGELAYVVIEMTFPDRCEHVVLRDRLPGGLAFEDGALATRESAQPPPLFEKEMNHFSLTSKAYLGAEVHFFGSAEQGTSVVLYPVRATTKGSFAIPAVVVEDMYHIDCVGGADPAEILTVE